MICPFCQHDIDLDSLACPRCHAAYPQPAKPFGFGIRKATAVASMLFVLSLILVDCVINWLPGGPDSLIATGSPQLRTQPYPDLKSPEVDALINQWAHGQQDMSKLTVKTVR